MSCPEPGAPLLEVRSVDAGYGPYRALFGVSFSVAPRSAVALVLPTTKEGWSMPIREALACGCPVVTTDGPWLDEDGSGTSVLRVSRPEPGLLAAAMRSVVEDAKVGSDLRTRGLALAAGFPTWEDRALRVMDVLAEVAAR